MTDTALLVIDVQTGFIDKDPHVHDGPVILKRIQTLIQQAKAANVPVIYVRHDEAPEHDGPLHPAITPADGDPVVSKMTPDSFHETNLKQLLDDLGTKNLVLVGFQTEWCINTTSHRAAEEGYNVTIVQDAHSTFDFDEQTATDIIADYTTKFEEIATLVAAADVSFA